VIFGDIFYIFKAKCAGETTVKIVTVWGSWIATKA